MSEKPIIVIGAGLSGLCCARRLIEAGFPIMLLEAGPEVGGRVRTEKQDGFLLDHGFQVLQTAYPEAQKILDYPLLKLHAFQPGALIRTKGRWVKMMDPWRRPFQALPSLFNGIGTIADRWKLASLRRHVVSQSCEQLMAEKDSSTLDYLSKESGLSMDCIDRFLRPWFGGVFFERNLETSSRFFRFIFRMFSIGDASLPEDGMKAIPEQLVQQIPADSIRLNTSVKSVSDGDIHLDGGEKIEARAVVLAVNEMEASRLSGQRHEPRPYRKTACLYYGAEKPPVKDPILVLNGDGTGPINNLCVPSSVSPSYAPPAKTLISVSVIDPESIQRNDLEKNVRHQLRDWFGAEVDGWNHLKTFRIPHALPSQTVGFFEKPGDRSRIRKGIYGCGDYRYSASIHGAMLSGRLTAEALIEDRV